MDIVDVVMSKKFDKATKIIRLWCITQLYYRQELGDKAWGFITTLTDKDVVTALAFISGFSMGAGMSGGKDYKVRLQEMLPELKEVK